MTADASIASEARIHYLIKKNEVLVMPLPLSAQVARELEWFPIHLLDPNQYLAMDQVTLATWNNS